MKRSDDECDACGYNAPLRAYGNPSHVSLDSTHSKLCALCARTESGNAWIYGQSQFPEYKTLYTICSVGNAVLDALGLLWPNETTAPTPTGPNEIEIERDALGVRLLELEEENASLDKQVEEAIRQRDSVLEAAQAEKLRHEEEMREAVDRIAKAEARAAVLNVSVPEDTTEEETDEDVRTP